MVMSSRPPSPAYIVAARRSALGRVGGLHKARRIEDLAAPVLAAALADQRLSPVEVDEVILGNALAGENPARLVALAAGLPDTCPAFSIDRQCGSGLDAILTAIHRIAAGEAEVVAAGGAESVSTAPWRVARPRSLYQLPHFIGLDPTPDTGDEEASLIPATEALARRLGIGRSRQDAWVVRSRLAAEKARDVKRFLGEIVPLRATPEESRDEGAGLVDPQALDRLAPLLTPDGTLTPGNTSSLRDGAAMVIAVSEAVWRRLGSPPALRLVSSTARGVAGAEEAAAPIEALRRLLDRPAGPDRSRIATIELGESSAAQAIALAETLGLDPDLLNPAGGAVVRGHPLAAAGAVLVVRLFTDLARSGAGDGRCGIAVQGVRGGIGLAALFEAVN